MNEPMTGPVRAIQLQDGACIESIEHLPNINLYRGEVSSIVVVDRGVQINYKHGGHVVVPEGALVEVRR